MFEIGIVVMLLGYLPALAAITVGESQYLLSRRETLFCYIAGAVGIAMILSGIALTVGVLRETEDTSSTRAFLLLGSMIGFLLTCITAGHTHPIWIRATTTVLAFVRMIAFGATFIGLLWVVVGCASVLAITR